MYPTLEAPNKRLSDVLGSGLTTVPAIGGLIATKFEGRISPKLQSVKSRPRNCFPFPTTYKKEELP